MHFGALDIELIEPDNEPSTWREFLDEHGEGFHHLAFSVKGMAQHTTNLEALGMPLIMKGEFTGGRYAYFDSNPSLKFILELLEHDKS
jgi:4-hydroxyphenylpyruvate dioxygenase-like putative hemolysin